MEQDVKFYLGIDVSKLWFDLSLMKVVNHHKEPMLTEKFDNNPAGLKMFARWLKNKGVALDSSSILVIENTGVYHRLIWEHCSTSGLPIYIGNAAHIKWSLGITRGKNDQIDSQRLCGYAYKHADEILATPALNPILLQLRDLVTSRDRVLAQANTIKVFLRELKGANSSEVQQIMELAHKPAIDGLKESLRLIEEKIIEIIKCEASLQTNHDLLLSVPGIGHITAVYLICCTNNFAGKVTGKQLACYAGVVPFGDQSGTSIKKRERVHRMANKDLKKLLHMCALSTITNHEEFKAYYERKRAEGKHAMSILNAIRNKIALRAVAVINKQEKYVDNYKKAA